MQEHSPELPIAGPIGMLGNSGSFDEANLMPSAQHPQKFYSRRQIFKFLNIFLTWLNVADKNKLYILNHNPLHTFLSKQQKKSLTKICQCYSLSCCLSKHTLLRDPTLLSYWLFLRGIVTLSESELRRCLSLLTSLLFLSSLEEEQSLPYSKWIEKFWALEEEQCL